MDKGDGIEAIAKSQNPNSSCSSASIGVYLTQVATWVVPCLAAPGRATPAALNVLPHWELARVEQSVRTFDGAAIALPGAARHGTTQVATWVTYGQFFEAAWRFLTAFRGFLTVAPLQIARWNFGFESLNETQNAAIARSFRPDYLRLETPIEALRLPPILALTATASLLAARPNLLASESKRAQNTRLRLAWASTNLRSYRANDEMVSFGDVSFNLLMAGNIGEKVAIPGKTLSIVKCHDGSFGPKM